MIMLTETDFLELYGKILGISFNIVWAYSLCCLIWYHFLVYRRTKDSQEFTFKDIFLNPFLQKHPLFEKERKFFYMFIFWPCLIYGIIAIFSAIAVAFYFAFIHLK